MGLQRKIPLQLLHFLTHDMALQLWSNLVNDPLPELTGIEFIIFAEFDVQNLAARVFAEN